MTTDVQFFPGTYASAIDGDTELSRLLSEFGRKSEQIDDTEGSGSDETFVADDAAIEREKETLSASALQKATQALIKHAVMIPIDVQKRATLKELKTSTRPKEKREQGSVKYSIYQNFIRANSYSGVRPPSFHLMANITELRRLFSGCSLHVNYRPAANSSNWNQSMVEILGPGEVVSTLIPFLRPKLTPLKRSQHNADTGDNGNLTFYLGIYAAFGLGASVTFLINGLLLYSLCVIRAAKVMVNTH